MGRGKRPTEGNLNKDRSIISKLCVVATAILLQCGRGVTIRVAAEERTLCAKVLR
jgi:hypothetical protein